MSGYANGGAMMEGWACKTDFAFEYSEGLSPLTVYTSEDNFKPCTVGGGCKVMRVFVCDVDKLDERHEATRAALLATRDALRGMFAAYANESLHEPQDYVDRCAWCGKRRYDSLEKCQKAPYRAEVDAAAAALKLADEALRETK